jgi:hypothetical protein
MNLIEKNLVLRKNIKLNMGLLATRVPVSVFVAYGLSLTQDLFLACFDNFEVD